MEYRNITDIKPNPKNPRTIKDEKFAKLVKSIKDFPQMLEKRPLVCFTDIDGKLVVLGGNNGMDIWDIERTQKNDLHPTMKPIPLCEKGISDGSLSNGIVLDIFLGSGSTMVAAHQLKRKCYGMELAPKYCQVIIDRMRKLDPSIVIKKNGHAI